MRYIIDFKQETTESQIDDYISDLGGSKIKNWNLFSNTVLIESASTPPVSDIVVSVVNDEKEIIEPLNYPQELDFNLKHFMLDSPEQAYDNITFSTTDNKDWWKNYILANPDFEADTVTIPRRGKNVSVYIMDSGITADHEEFSESSITNIWTVTPNDYSDPNGHGTAIASVIAGKTVGLTNADLKIVKIFRSDRGTFVSEFLDALSAIGDDADLNKTSVINCSWSIPKNSLIEDKIQQLIDRNILVVAAAGNNNLLVEDVTPAAMPDVMCVGSYNTDLAPSDFSNYQSTSSISYSEFSVNGGGVNNWAPGEEIWAAEKSGGYAYTAGTSMSAAIATTIIAYRLSFLIDSSGYILPEFTDKKIIIGEWQDPSLETEEEIIKAKLTSGNHLLLSIVGKVDLLDFDDTKFEKANNWLISLPYRSQDIAARKLKQVPERGIRYVFEKEKSMLGGLKQLATSFDKIELLEAMPEFCSFTNYGDILVDKPEFSNATASFYDSYELRFAVLDNGNKHEYTIELRVMSEDTDVDEKIENDQELRVTLLSVCGPGQFGVQFCPFSGTEIPGCPDNCTNLTACCWGGFNKSADACICYSLF